MCCLTVLKLAFIVMDLLDSSNRLGWHILSIFQEYILRCKGLKWLLEKSHRGLISSDYLLHCVQKDPRRWCLPAGS